MRKIKILHKVLLIFNIIATIAIIHTVLLYYNIIDNSSWYREMIGNQMPMVGAPAPAPRPLKATVYIYDSTHISKVKQIGTSPLFSMVITRLVQKLDTNEAGQFSAALPAGTYSVFVLKGEAFFANQFDEKNNIGICRVEVGKQTRLQITVNTDASY